MKGLDKETIIGGIFGLVAIFAAIISTILGEVNASAIWDCIKDIAGSIIAVILLFAIFKSHTHKKAGDFIGGFNEELENLYKKYGSIFFADSTEKGKSIYRHNIARKLDGIITGDVGNERDIRFFDFDYAKSTIEFFVQGKIFGERVNDVAKDIYHKLNASLNGIAKVTPKYQSQVSIKIEFNNPLVGIEDAKFVARIIDDTIFYYVTEYKK